jgi:hypothetical protein
VLHGLTNIFETSLTGSGEVAVPHNELEIDGSLHKQVLGAVLVSNNVAINALHYLIIGDVRAINFLTQVPRSTMQLAHLILRRQQ